MKKTYIDAGVEWNTLYIGISDVYGDWILTTGGNPVTLNDLEDADAQDELDEINAIIADTNTPWEDCTEDDLKYIRDTLTVWGIEDESEN